MYAAFVAIAVAQIFMLQNWLIGPAFLLSAIPFYLQRVKREEKLLINKFGSDYLDYMDCTGEVIPKPSQIEFRVPERLTKIFRKK